MTYFDGECSTCDEFLETTLGEVQQERRRQDKKWGQQNHNPAVWLAILGEEVGEANKAFCDSLFTLPLDKNITHNELRHMRTELIQVAAVSVAIVESLDRNELALLGGSHE